MVGATVTVREMPPWLRGGEMTHSGISSFAKRTIDRVQEPHACNVAYARARRIHSLWRHARFHR